MYSFENLSENKINKERLRLNTTETLAATHLGKKSVGSELYDKSLLVAIPRSENRLQYDIQDNNLPFVGYDVWNAYEVSFMTTRGIPYNCVLKIKYPANSPYIVESKSLKLYLNSFNMTPLKPTVEESIAYFYNTVKQDLSECLKTDVRLFMHEVFTDTQSKMFEQYEPIQALIDINNIECTHFKESPEELVEDPTNSYKDLKISFNALRSNCRVTHQPDFGDLFIHIKSDKGIDLVGLFKYLTSFRKEYHFHEECVEMIYKRLHDIYSPDILMVGALYTRRGGIDICPIRANKPEYLDAELLNIFQYTRRTAKQ